MAQVHMKTVTTACWYLLLLALVLFCLGPVVWQLATSLKPEVELTHMPPLMPQNPTLSNYRAIFAEHPFSRIMLNSATVAGSTTLFSLIVGSLAAFALAKLELAWRGMILGFVLSASMFPPIATVSPLYIIVRWLGLRDTLAALIMTYTTFSLPLTIWILTNFFREIPDEVVAAARIDGCSRLQVFYKIVLPLSGPGLVTTALLVFIFSWNEFLFALSFTSTPASRTIPVAIALFPGIHEIPWATIAAASIVVTLPIMVLVFIFQKRIVEGLTGGAVKG